MTAMIHLSKFLPMILPHVPECPHSVATFNARLAGIEFCERTRCWRHLTTVELTEDGQALAAPVHSAIHRIEKAVFNNDITLEPIQFSDVDEAGMASDGASSPRYITQATYNTIRVLPFVAGDLSLSLFLKPVNGRDMQENDEGVVEDAFDTLPEFIYTMHAESIAYGAVSRLLSQPNKPWSDMNTAMVWRQRFEDDMNRHFSVNLTGQQRAPRRTRFRDF